MATPAQSAPPSNAAPVNVPDLSRIHLREVRFLEWNLREHAATPPAVDEFTVQTSTELWFDVSQRRLDVRFLFTITAHPAADPQTVAAEAQIALLLGFVVDDLERQLVPVDTRPDPVPGLQLSLTVAGVAYSTARGLLLAKLANTLLEGYALPLQDARNLLIGNKQSSATAPKAAKPRAPRKPSAPKEE